MKYKTFITVVMAVAAVTFLSGGNFALGSDLDDGISKFSDESIGGDAKMGKAETNINFIVLESMAEAKQRQKTGDQNANFNDGSGDNNQNSVVCEVGAKCDKVINININK
jgi:hypothetical protein